MLIQATSEDSANAHELAANWLSRLEQAHHAPSKQRLPSNNTLALATLAECSASILNAGKTLFIIVPDDDWLPELSNALDLNLRPLCLVLPQANFAAAITLRATLSLLKSRLSRDVDPECAFAWERQHTHLAQLGGLWKTALDWNAKNFDSSPWPTNIDELFPVCILPDSQAIGLTSPVRDYVLLLHPERMISALPRLLKLGHRGLLLQSATAIGRDMAPIDEEKCLKAEFDMLAQELGELELEFATAQGELAEFTRRYYAHVGSRIAALDALEAQISQHMAANSPNDTEKKHRAEQAQAQAEQSRQEEDRFSEADHATDKPFAPSKDLKRLFRNLAQKIHPDRAVDEEDRVWRTELMSEANRAYRSGDAMVLQEILNQWQTGKREASNRPTSSPTTHGLAAQNARMQRRLAEISTQLNRLLASRLYELFIASNQARNRNRDLLQEMAERLDIQIAATQAQLAELIH